MVIRRISCTQFAGVCDRDVSLSNGINIIYGKNESGKSTLVNLLFKTLFQNARVDGRSDKDFVDQYFPSAKKGAVSGDYIDGKVSIETDEGTYTLSKEWGSDSRCVLSTPEGAIRDREKIEEILKGVLLYGEGVYSDLLFSSQKNTDSALRTLLDASDKKDARNTKQEIADAVTLAFAESDGITTDSIEKAIDEKIDEIAGKHWDFERNAPAKKSGAGRWSNGIGEILKAYYALEDANETLENISKLEADVDRALAEYVRADGEAAAAEEKYEKFNAFASLLTLKAERAKNVSRLVKEDEKLRGVLSSWPSLERSLERARRLRKEKAERELLDKYEKAKQYSEELKKVDAGLLSAECPSDDEMKQVRTAQTDITKLENRLCGINISAAIEMFGGNTVEITSLRTGNLIEINDGEAQITEAVRLRIPGVMDMELSPADVDVGSVESQIATLREAVGGIFNKYGVSSLDELDDLRRRISSAVVAYENAKGRFSAFLGDTSFEALETSAGAIGNTVRTKAEIDSDISESCNGKDVSSFVASVETVISGYIAEYGSISELETKAGDVAAELRKAKESLSETSEIPAEYAGITDPESHLRSLQEDCKLKRRNKMEALETKTSAISRAETYKEGITVDPISDVERKRQAYEEQKTLLGHWIHIRKIFTEQKESVHDNPMQDVADRFMHNLGIISGGRISSEFPDAEKLNMKIYSGNTLVDYKKLSEGTKETVYLAFRIAALDHLFPDGGGVIVLDDPFANMDADRTAGACELFKDCARRHQVVFLTCKEEYTDMMSGNVIRF